MADIYLSNIGCKLNQAEIEAYGRRLEADGHRLVGTLEEADVHLVNSCTVTHVAARDSRKVARRGARAGRGVRTVVTGCYATADTERAAGLQGVGLVVPNSRKEDLVDAVYARWPDLAPEPPPSDRSEEPVPVSYVPLSFANTRGAIKVEDGCNMTCAFCIIPSTRGRQRSRPLGEIVAELEGLVEQGYREIVVTGVQISSYRDGERRLVDLVRALLDGTRIPRLRLTSIAPWQFDRRLLELWPEDRLCRHFHLSLQSGCTDTLRRMRRPYTAETYRELVDEIRRHVPGVAITTDVIAGFPGECEGEFEESLAFVEECGFTRVHAFPYSERPGTRSAEMEDSVDPGTKKERVLRMREVGEAGETAFARSHVDRPLQVLWETDRDGWRWGTSDNYLRVRVEPREAPALGTLSAESFPRLEGGILTRPTLRSARSRPAALNERRDVVGSDLEGSNVGRGAVPLNVL